ncbi:MAG: hypothetical protein A4E53_00335 [Pelotomaculum sp. PtaB.Bin104]|nr:MAG: hypothetical protein A4E53_00335 [Pelotomaculum sp. PtaB.Bin104]
MKGFFTKLHNAQKGQAFIEVALIIILIVFAIAGPMRNLGTEIGNKTGEMRDRVTQVGVP